MLVLVDMIVPWAKASSAAGSLRQSRLCSTGIRTSTPWLLPLPPTMEEKATMAKKSTAIEKIRS